MQGIFEKNIEQKLSGFSIEPSVQIWIEVEKALHPPRKHRGILWWWVPLAGVLTLGLLVWEYNTNKHLNEPSVQNIATNGKQNKATIVFPKKDSIAKIKTANEDAAKEKTLNNIGALIISRNNIQPQYKTNNNVFINNEYIPEKKTINIIKAETSKNTTEEPNTIVASAIQNNNETLILDSTQKTTSTITQPDSVTKQKDSISKATVNQIKKFKKQAREWFIVADAGTITINDFTLLPNLLAPANYSNFVTNGGGSGSSQTSVYTTNSKTGFHFTTGIRYRKEISPVWNFETGIQHHYFQNKQLTGIRVDSIAGSSDHYYKAGSSNLITNNAFAIEVPLSINYILNPKSKNKIYLQGGISMEWLFAKKWLIPNNQLTAYYYESSLIKNFQVNASLGIGIHFANNIQFIIKSDQGISSFYQLNNKANYKQQISAQLLFPLHLSLKKRNKNK